MDRKRNVESKEEIAEQLSTIIFNLAEIEDFDPDIPLSELNLDPMELIEALRAEFDVDIAEQQIKNESQTLLSLVDFYGEELLQDGSSAESNSIIDLTTVAKANEATATAESDTDDQPTILNDGVDMFIELARARTANALDQDEKPLSFQNDERTTFLNEKDLINDERVGHDQDFAGLNFDEVDDTQILLPDEFIELELAEAESTDDVESVAEPTSELTDEVPIDVTSQSNGAYDEIASSEILEVSIEDGRSDDAALADSPGTFVNEDVPVDRLFDDIELAETPAVDFEDAGTEYALPPEVIEVPDEVELTAFREAVEAPISAEDDTQLLPPDWEEPGKTDEGMSMNDAELVDSAENSAELVLPVSESRDLADPTIISLPDEEVDGKTQILVPASSELMTPEDSTLEPETIGKAESLKATADAELAEYESALADAKQLDDQSEAVTQIFMPDNAAISDGSEPTLIKEPVAAEDAGIGAVEELVAEDVTQLLLPDQESDVVEAKADELTQIFERDSADIGLPDASELKADAGVMAESLEANANAELAEYENALADAKQLDDQSEAVTQIFMPDNAAISDGSEPTLIKEPIAAEDAGTDAVEELVAEDVTQLLLPGSETDGSEPTLIKLPEPGAEDVTQLFTPDSALEDSFTEATLIKKLGLEDDVTQLFTPGSIEAARMEEETFLKDITPSEGFESLPADTSDVTQIFTPDSAIDSLRDQSDEILPVVDAANLPGSEEIDLLPESTSDVTQIFAPDAAIESLREQPDEMLQAVDNADLPGPEELAPLQDSSSDVTQIFAPGLAIDALREEPIEALEEVTEIEGGIIPADVVAEIEAEEDIVSADDDYTQIFIPGNDPVAEAELEQIRDSVLLEPIDEDESVILKAAATRPEIDEQPMVAGMVAERPDAPVYEVVQKAPNHFGIFELADESADTRLSARQRKHLEHLMQRLKRKSMKSRRHAADNMTRQADPVSAESYRSIWREIAMPPVAARSKNGHIWDIDGNDYIDITLGGGAHFLGHAPEYITSAVGTALERGFEIGIQSQVAGEVAMMLQKETGVERIGFMQDGTDAIRSAIRIARTVTQREKIVIFNGSYHGDFDEALVRPIVREGKLHGEAVAPGITQAAVDNVFVLQYGSAESVDFIERNGSQIAAVLVEPVQRFHPERQSKQFVEALRRAATGCQAALIFDETTSGFRTHLGGIQMLWGIEADMVAWGSTMAAGLPLGVLGGAARWMNTIDGGAWSVKGGTKPEATRTFISQAMARHPLSLAAANSALRFMVARGPGLQKTTDEKVERLSAEINAYFEECKVPIQIHHFSSWFRFEIPYELGYADLLTFHLREKGIYLDNIRQTCFLSSAHTDKDVKKLVKAVKESVDALQHSRFLPAPQDSPYPLSSMQESVWLATQVNEDAATAFNRAFTLRMQGEIDQAVLVDALDMVVRRYDGLHVRISAEDQTQHYDAATSDLLRIDLSELTADEQQRELWSIHDTLTSQPFNLKEDILYQFAFVTLADDDVILMMASHAMVFDGWSIQVLIDELRQLYNGLVSQSTLILPPTQSYSDFVSNEEEILTGNSGRKAKEWWLSQLADTPEALTLPTDRQRPAQRSFRGNTASYKLDAIVIERARQTANAHGSSFSELLLAAYTALLHTLSEQTDMVVGIPFAQQPGAKMDGLVGSAETLLPLRLNINKADSLAALLKIVSDQWQAALPHAAATFGSLLKELGMKRDVAQSPLIQTVFAISQPPMTTGFSNMAVTFDRPAVTATNFDLTWRLIDDGKQVQAQIDFNPDLFEEATIGSWLDQFENLLEQFTHSAEQVFIEQVVEVEAEESSEDAVHSDEVVAVPALPEVEISYEAISAEWNQTATVFKTNQTFIDLFIQQVSQKPGMLAAVAETGSRLTYDELDIDSNRLANYLRSLELVNDSLIGICMGRSATVLTTMLGVMKAGYAWVALDSTAPAEVNEMIINAAGLATIITEQGMLAPELAHCCLVDPIFIDGQWPTISQQPASRSNRAMVSTAAFVNYRIDNGKPIGVQISQGALANIARAMMVQPGMSRNDSILNIASLSQPEAIIELLLPLVNGARIIMASDATVSNHQRMAQILNKAKINLLQADIALVEDLIRSGWHGGSDVRVFARGKAGDSLVATLRARGIALWSLWGSAETGSFALAHNCSNGNPEAYGKPVANMQASVLLGDLSAAGIGQVGRLYISGENLASGYVGDFEMTQSSFIEAPDYVSELDVEVDASESQILMGKQPTRISPRGRVAHARGEGVPIQYPVLLDTGLYACWHEDGILYPADKPAPPAQSGDNERVVGSESDAANDSAELAAPIFNLTSQPTQIILPESRTEAIMSDIWRELLDRKTIDADSDFFTLGGHSLLGVALLTQVEQKLGVRMPLSKLFNNPTVRSLSRAVDTTDWAEVAASTS